MMRFAITPCPNDTFSYRALVDCAEREGLQFIFDDIENLNLAAGLGRYEITKLSFAHYMNCRSRYELLDAGAALGIGTGPVLVGRLAEFDASKPVAVPGLNTTAAMLLRRKYGRGLREIPMHFRDIAEAVARGDFAAGVLIHEGRFVYESQGLKLMCDLGKYWTDATGLPVPLGCICIRKDFSAERPRVERLIRESIDAAFADPERAYPYVKSMAQHLDGDVLKSHIYAFVNEYSKDIAPLREKLLEELSKC